MITQHFTWLRYLKSTNITAISNNFHYPKHHYLFALYKIMATEIIDFNQLWDLLESEYTCLLYNRHIIALNRIAKIRSNGIVKFLLQHLDIYDLFCFKEYWHNKHFNLTVFSTHSNWNNSIY